MHTDTERLDWLLKFAFGKVISNGAADWDYIPITSREQIDRAMAQNLGGNESHSMMNDGGLAT